MKHEINTDAAVVAGAGASAAARGLTTVFTVVSRDAAAEAAAPAASASIACFMFLSNFQLLSFDLIFDLYFVTSMLHVGVGNITG